MSHFKDKTQPTTSSLEALSNSEDHQSQEDHLAPTVLPKKQQQHQHVKKIENQTQREVDSSRQSRVALQNKINRQKCKMNNKNKLPDAKDMVKKQKRKKNAAPPEVLTQSSKSKSESPVSSDKQQAAPDQPKQSPTLYIGNLPLELNQSQIRKLFKKYGSLKQVKLMVNTTTGKSKGFGFVQYWDLQSAIKAKYELSSHILDGLKITIEFCESQ